MHLYVKEMEQIVGKGVDNEKRVCVCKCVCV